MTQQQKIIPNVMMWFSFASLALLYGVMCPEFTLLLHIKGYPVLIGRSAPMDLIFHRPIFFEHVHRVIAVITGSMILVTTVYATKNAKSVRKTAIAGSIIVSVQILLGMWVVNNKLEALLVATHLSTGVLLFAMTLMTFLSSYRLTKNNSCV